MNSVMDHLLHPLSTKVRNSEERVDFEDLTWITPIALAALFGVSSAIIAGTVLSFEASLLCGVVVAIGTLYVITAVMKELLFRTE